jgi:hypothetical protein
VDIDWEIKVTLGVPPVSFHGGTIEEVVTQATQMNPNFEADFALNATGVASVVENRQASRDNFRLICFDPRKPANSDHIKEGINHLWWVSGKNGPGPGNCGRVSCSHNSAIYCMFSLSAPVRKELLT